MAVKSKDAKHYTMSVPSGGCSGCLMCLLACSYFNEEVFSLAKARLRISRNEDGTGFSVAFLPNCIKCGHCADYCHWGAIIKSDRKEVKQ